MIFDSTIVAVRISSLNISMTTVVTLGQRMAGAAIMVGHENLDSADIAEHPLDSSIGPPWMWHAMGQLSLGQISRLNLPLVSSVEANGVSVRANRRFRENNQTLWMIVTLNVDASDTAPLANGFVRTLIRIP